MINNNIFDAHLRALRGEFTKVLYSQPNSSPICIISSSPARTIGLWYANEQLEFFAVLKKIDASPELKRPGYRMDVYELDAIHLVNYAFA